MKKWKLTIPAASALLYFISTSVTTVATGPTAVVLTGQTAPGTGGGLIASVSRPSVNGFGDVAFQSDVNGSSVRHGIFLSTGGSISRIVLHGDTAPNGQPFINFGEPALNDSRNIAFYAHLNRGFDNQGVFFYSGGSLSPIALTGQSAPGTDGSFGIFGRAAVSLNNAGTVVFGATVKGSPVTNGIFRYNAGVLSPVVLSGQPASGTGGGNFSRFLKLAMNQTGQVAFAASTVVGSAGSGIFLATGDTITSIAVEGQSAPYAGGGSFSSLEQPSINDVGEITFVDSTKSGGRFSPPSTSKGLFLYSSGSISLIAAPNQQTSPGDPILAGNFHRPALIRFANGNRILFVAWNRDSGHRALLVSAGGTLTQLLQEGDPSPSGGVYSFIGHQFVESQGHFAFVSNLQGASGIAGIFRDTINF